jgi:hypothetical protein
MPIERKKISVDKAKERKKKKEKKAEKPDFYQFFKATSTDKGALDKIIINRQRLLELLKSFGFYRYDLDIKSSKLIRIQSKLVEEVSRQLIIDHFEEWIKNDFDYSTQDLVESEDLLNKIYCSLGQYFSEDLLNRLRLEEEITLNRDKVDRAYLYYRNGFVEIDKEGWALRDYSELDNYIWKHQRIDRNFKLLDIDASEDKKLNRKNLGVFGDYIFKVANQESYRFHALCSIIGYNLHDFHDYKLKATVLTDSSLSDDAEGRTGKTLFCKALGFIRKYCEINGKDFNLQDKHKYSGAELDTQVIHLNDVRTNFNFESLFNDITEGLTVDKKNDKPFKLRSKMLVSTNKTIRINGSSSRDRSIEFEFSDYFSDRHSPEDEYKQWFFRDWDELEWQRFDNFMCHCTCVFLQKGILPPGTINLEERKLREETKPEFIDFMEDILSTTIKNGGNIHEVEYDKASLFTQFKERYVDFNNTQFKQRTFTQWLKTFAKLRYGINTCLERKSGSDYFIQFKEARETINRKSDE